MTKKIFWSVFLVSIIVLLSCLTLIMGILYTYFGARQKDQLKTELELAVKAVETSGVRILKEVDTGSFRLTYISEDGDVLYDSIRQADEMENHADREEFKEALEYGAGESTRYSSTLTEQTLYCANRLSDRTVLRASVSRMTVLSLLLGMMQPIVFILVTALVLSLILAKRVAKRIIEPLNVLDLDEPLENDTYEELTPLLTHMERQHRMIAMQKQELVERQNEFYTVIENMNEGLVLLSKEERILSMNPAAASFFQSGEDMTGEEFLSLGRNDDINKSLERAEKDGHSELTVSRTGREYQINISRIETDGRLSGTVILIFDITEKVFAERNRREFTANVSHELKTPLHSIMGSAELMENGLVKAEDTPEFVRRIRKEAERLVALIEDIIRLSQLDEITEMAFEEIDLYETAKEEIEALLPAAGEKSIQISLEGEAAKINGVRQLVHEIIYNLCDNAIRYNTENGTIRVTVGKEEEDTFLTVADTGIGIAAEYQTRVFERFFRVDKSHSRKIGGTGLGLSIVKHAIQYMDGTIALNSRPGEGTTVTVGFPLKKA